MEGGDCILPAISVKRVQGQLASGGTVGGSFQECVAPDSLELSTRKGYQALWRTVLTWGIVHEVVGDLLPMSDCTRHSGARVHSGGSTRQ